MNLQDRLKNDLTPKGRDIRAKFNKSSQKGMRQLTPPKVVVDNEVAAGIASHLQSVTEQLAFQQQQMLKAMAQIAAQCEQTLALCAQALQKEQKAPSVSVEAPVINQEHRGPFSMAVNRDDDGKIESVDIIPE